MNIYDYMKSPTSAVKRGYKPNYLTKVSAVLNRVYTKPCIAEYKSNIQFGMEESVNENLRSLFLVFAFAFIFISTPVLCWLYALMLPNGRDN